MGLATSNKNILQVIEVLIKSDNDEFDENDLYILEIKPLRPMKSAIFVLD